MDVKPLIFQVESVFDIIAVALSSWVVITSFDEAHFWHFIDPITTGFSIRGTIALFLSFCITPWLLSWPKLRILKLNSVCLLLVKILPALLLMIVSLPQLNQTPWTRTVLLGFGVALQPFIISWVLVRSADRLQLLESKCSIKRKSEQSVEVSLNENAANPVLPQKTHDNFIDVMILTAIFINMSIRYCTATINVFYEDWRFSLGLFVTVLLLAILNGVLEHFQEKVKKEKSDQYFSFSSVNGENNKAVASGNLNTKSFNHENTALKHPNSFKKIQQKMNMSSTSTFVVSTGGCIHGILIGFLTVIFLWFFSSPNFLCRISGLEPYYNGVAVILGLMLGIITTILFRPEKLCSLSYSATKKTLSESEISMRIYVKQVILALLLVVLLCMATGLLVGSRHIGSFIGSILFCLSLPYCFSLNVQSLTWIVSIASNNGTSTFIRLLPGFIAFLTGLSFIVLNLFFVLFINPQFTNAFFGNMGLILGIVIFFIFLSLSFFIAISKTLVKTIDNNNLSQSSLCKWNLAPSLWIEKIQRKISINQIRLLVYSLICLIVTIVTLSVGPRFNRSHCIYDYEGLFANLSAHNPFTSANDGSQRTFSVLSWNILLGHKRNGRNSLPCIAELMDILDPDVIALQESDALPPYWGGKDILGYLSGSLSKTVFGGVNPLQANLGVGILTSYKVTNHQRYILQEDNNQRLPHYSLIQIDCVIQEQPVTIFNLHAVFKNWTRTAQNPSPFAEVSKAQMQFIAKKANRTSSIRPTIVMGDFNLNPHEAELDIFYELGFSSALIPNREHVTFPSTINNRKAVIDHIFFKNMRLLQTFVYSMTSDISDHYRIMAAFQLL